jgi:predicted DNA-binding transcriptional regulator YafY
VRADRLLSLLLILRQRSRATARELAVELEVSERTVLRDIEALSAAGVPVYAARGCRGGFALLDGWTTDMSGLTAPETQALLAAGSRSSARALGLGSAFASGLSKVLASMPAEQRARTIAASSRILVTTDAFVPTRETTPFLGLLQRAVIEGRRVRLGYHGRTRDTPTTRTIDPVGLVHAQAVWYLVANHRGQPRTYRVGRVTTAALLDEPARRPPDADLDAVWSASRSSFLATLDAVTVLVDVESDAHERRPLPGIEHDGASPGWQRLELHFGDRGQATGVLWSYGPAVRVHSPGWLADELRERAAAMLLPSEV